MKVLFSSFPKNDPQTKTLEPHCKTKQTVPHESTVQAVTKCNVDEFTPIRSGESF